MSDNPTTPGVEYKPVAGFEMYYRVGDDGSVWSCRGKGYRKPTGRWVKLNPVMGRGERLAVTFYPGAKSVHVHLLVAETFIGPKPLGPTKFDCCHNNGKPTDNRASNLRWDTPKGNAADKKLHGTENIGVRNGNAKLTPEKVRKIREMLAAGIYQKVIAAEFDIIQQAVSCIARKKTWSHLA